MAHYPEIAPAVDFRDEIVDLVAGGFDLALRISTLSDSSLLARRLCTARILLVGAPVYFARHRRPLHPRELAAHRRLIYTNSHLGDAWRFHHRRHGDTATRRHGDFAIAVPASLSVNNAEALAPSLLSGQGLALQPEFLVLEALKKGQLGTAMPHWTAPPIALHIVTPPSRARPARVRVLIDFLVDSFQRAPWAQTD